MCHVGQCYANCNDDKRRLSPAWRLRIERGKERQPYDAHSSPPDKTRRLWMATDADASSWLWMSLTGMEHLADGINLYTRLYEKLYKMSYKKLRRAMFIWFTCRTVNTPAAPSVYYPSHQYFKHCALKRQMFRTPAACNYRWLLFAANSAAVVRVREKNAKTQKSEDRLHAEHGTWTHLSIKRTLRKKDYMYVVARIK